jgi:hypothetical protein
VTVFDARVPTAITEAARIMIPGGADAGAISPDGKMLAILTHKDNQLSLIDLSDLAAPRLTKTVSLMPNEAVPLVRSLQFDPEGDELWVVGGDSQESLVAGARPTSITVVALGADPKVARTVAVGVAAAPLDLAVATRESTLAATAIRSTRKRAAMVLATAEAAVLKGEQGSGRFGKLLVTDLDGGARPLSAGDALYLDNQISHDRAFVVSATRTREAGSVSVGITVTPLESGKAKYLSLEKESASELLAPLYLALAP